MLKSKLTSFTSIALLSSLFLSLAGCMPLYSPPPTGAKAKLGARNEHVFSNENQIAIYDDPIQCKGQRNLFDLRHRFNGKPVLIQAEKLTTIADSHLIFGYMPSTLIVTFYPHKNTTYLINTENSNWGSGTIKSKFQIEKVVKNDNGKINYIPVPFIKRKAKQGLFSVICVDKNLQEKLKHFKPSSLS